MYKCPAKPADCENTGTFDREVAATATLRINAAGEVVAKTYTDHEQSVAGGHVRCAECGARAEWQDTRQGELFAVEPTLADVLA